MDDARRGSMEVQRVEQEARSSQAQLAQWIAEKTGQEGALQCGASARVEQIDQSMQGIQQRLTQAQVTCRAVVRHANIVNTNLGGFVRSNWRGRESY